MVTHHPEEGHPHSKIYQNKLYYRLAIWHLDLAHKIKTRWSAMDGYPPSPGWSPTIPRKVNHNPKFTRRKCTTDLKFGNLFELTKLRPGEVPWTVSHHLKDGHPPWQERSPTIQNLPEGILSQPWNLSNKIKDQVKCRGWSATIPRKVTHNPKSSKCYRLEIWHLDLTYKIKTRWCATDS